VEVSVKFDPYILCSDPTVIALQVRESTADLIALIRQLKPETHVLVHFSWYGMYELAKRIAHLQYEYRDKYHFHLMVNTPEELLGYMASGLPTLHAPASLFVSESTFRIRNVPKQYDALYIANFSPGDRDNFKRHLLAQRISRLRVVTYPMRNEIPDNTFAREFFRTFPELSHAEVNSRYLSPLEVARAIATAHVHLALSEEEGCMLGFTEGLLCGVPGISTECKGGREQFFHPSFVQLVAPDAEEVSLAVKRALEQDYDPNAIRQFALGRLSNFRTRYVRYVARLAQKSADEIYAELFGTAPGPDRLCFGFRRPTGSERPGSW
jgi:glycosyltransferase involved in cell wall biosynthesis